MSALDALYTLNTEICLPNGTASHVFKNLSQMYIHSKYLQYVAYVHHSQVNTICWNRNLCEFTHGHILVKDPNPEPEKEPKSLNITQAKFCEIKSRNRPVLVVCTTIGALIYEWDGSGVLHWIPLPKENRANWSFTRGVASLGKNVFIGTHTGNIYCATVNGTTVIDKCVLQDVQSMIADLAADKETLACAGADGMLICWNTDLKVVMSKKIEQPLSCVEVFNTQVFCATMMGKVMVFDISTGNLNFDIDAHVRPITAFDFATDSDLLLTASEDSYVRVWKLPPGKNDEVELMYSASVPDALIVGGCFLLGGFKFVVTGFDHGVMFHYELSGDSESYERMKKIHRVMKDLQV